ncbi:DsbA family oxidoreductase [Halobacillus salinus]|uniref:DsbA family oxidoreductase n=1 Tax=Halobacillus salinus TaxID=192814 RepID=A0A4Z0GVE9_9BACI|nr:DsbA family oxidoreductase [Halobacillus salinus]TGB01672.1 DsbA family oxidoreductase [Halobacillus salinus]
MKIEVWSDFVCPFCYIGKARLENALEAFPQKDQVELVFKSFELDPQAEKNTGQNIHEKLAAKYGRSLEEARGMTANMTEQAKMEGLDFRFDDMVPTNTFDAHRIAKLAESKGIGLTVAQRFFQAVFTDGEDVGDHDTLIRLATEAGLDESNVKETLESDAFTEQVRSEQGEAYQIGVQGVPFFVINRKYAISGAQPKETFTQALEKAFEEEKATPQFETFSQNEDAACTEDGCEVPKNQ